MTVTIAEELLLLAYSDDKGKPLINITQLDPALAGAILAELAIARRVELAGRLFKKLTVTSSAPLGDEELDAALALIAAKSSGRSPAWWVHELQSGKLRGRLLSRLVAAGILSEQRSRVLGLFTVTRWPEAHPGAEANVRERVSAVLAGAHPDDRTAALIAITRAAGLSRKAFPGASRRRVKEIARGSWAADAVAQTIAAIESAVMTTGSSSSGGGGGGDGGDGGGD
ncbi:GPP34 family phosphoprotein [Nonomuraea sp. PA05]|uniref:GOLPH3/VPS74 family protein n=1 Tax=Nonomuraea sp. PA05 TaxID=2604466 RepID=UPI0011D46FC8|nr:GPP34 family phosphoprotein [Nonomuraea sp. PA05]TYB51766.1 GPP34 family phosphoprotein [Nonomuraea sp. PA05]